MYFQETEEQEMTDDGDSPQHEERTQRPANNQVRT